MLKQTSLATTSASQNLSIFQTWHQCLWFVITAGHWIKNLTSSLKLTFTLSWYQIPSVRFLTDLLRQIPEFFSNKPSCLPFIIFPLTHTNARFIYIVHFDYYRMKQMNIPSLWDGYLFPCLLDVLQRKADIHLQYVLYQTTSAQGLWVFWTLPVQAFWVSLWWL